MPILETPDGRYVFAVETPNEGDGNSVVYRREDDGTLVPVWDRFGWDAHLPPIAPPSPPPQSVRREPIRVTNATDGTLINRGYSYWPQAWINPVDGRIYVFAHRPDGPPLFFVVAPDGSIQRLGDFLPYPSTGEGWYWSADGEIYLCDGPRLVLVNPLTGARQIVMDISTTHPGCDLWQAHSSEDGQTHSATVRRIVSEGKYPNIGTRVSHRGHEHFFDAIGDLDESALAGDVLIIKEDAYNRIINLATGERHIITDDEGALAHSDGGDGFAVGEADRPEPGGCVQWNYQTMTMRRLLDTRALGHVSVRGGRCLRADAENISLIDLDGGGETILVPHGMVVPPGIPDWKKYDFQCMANLDPTGRVAAYVSNKEGRFDLYLLVIAP